MPSDDRLDHLLRTAARYFAPSESKSGVMGNIDDWSVFNLARMIK